MQEKLHICIDKHFLLCYYRLTETQERSAYMFNKKAFHLAVISADMTYEEVAKAIGINASTLYRKASGRSEFTRSEIQDICEVLSIDSPMEIFFDNKLT